jgi:hypothetical protein
MPDISADEAAQNCMIEKFNQFLETIEVWERSGHDVASEAEMHFARDEYELAVDEWQALQ